MNRARLLASAAFASAALIIAQPAATQTIYPLTRAEILAGSKFDLKVEFDGAIAPPDLKVTINGRDAAQVLGKSASVEANEEGPARPGPWRYSLTDRGSPGKR
jgi:alkaline phosphatase